MLTKFMSASFAALAAVVAIPVATQATPGKSATVARAVPTPKPTPPLFVVNGYLRSYYFTRQNASNNPGFQYAPPPAKYNYNAINQASFETALSLHAGFNFGGFQVAGTYLFADPLGTCDLVSDNFKGLPCISHKLPNTNPDNTLPGYQLATFYEAYAGYTGNGLYARVGNQVINTPWANASDSRVKPAAFQGGDLAYTWGPWTVEGMDMWAFQSRVSSFFVQDTLLTGFPPTGNTGLGGNNTPPGNIHFASNDPFGFIKTDGFWFGRIGYVDRHGLTGDVDYYAVQNIANMLWIDGKYAWRGYVKPFVAIQLGDENNAGASVIGKVDSQMYGVQAGLNVMPQVQLVGSFDDLPWHSDTITLPSGVSCNSSTHQLKIPTPANGVYEFPYFIPNNTSQCVPGATPGTATVFYGGWASPYTDSYATDPMFTGMMTQTVADRHIAGPSYKEALVFTSADHRFVGLISHADYDATNAGDTLYSQWSSENNIDGMWYVMPLHAGQRYHGLLLRYRYGERFFTNTKIYGGTPLFKYNRAQLEWDF
jgi:hypothetical protein